MHGVNFLVAKDVDTEICLVGVILDITMINGEPRVTVRDENGVIHSGLTRHELLSQFTGFIDLPNS